MGERTDCIIIGGGPAGLSAAINAIARGKNVRLLSADSAYLSRAESVDNYLGIHHVTGAELMNRFEEHAAVMGVKPEKGRVSNIMPLDEYFLINFGGEILEAVTVILATGAAKAKPVPGEDAFLGKGVSYCATCDGMLYRGKRAIVWGLADDAVEETEFLRSIGVDVTFVARERPPELNEAIPFVAGSVREITGEAHVTAAVVGEESLFTDVVFILRNAIAPSTLVSGLAVENGFVSVNRLMETNVPGLYAAGDCTGIPLQVANAVGDGLTAAQQAARYIDALKKKKQL